jgi:hypothetical protein
MIAETLLTFLFLVSFCGLCWAVTLNRSLRYKIEKGAWRFYRLETKQDREDYDALIYAGFLVGALTTTTIFFALLIALLGGYL